MLSVGVSQPLLSSQINNQYCKKKATQRICFPVSETSYSYNASSTLCNKNIKILFNHTKKKKKKKSIEKEKDSLITRKCYI